MWPWSGLILHSLLLHLLHGYLPARWILSIIEPKSKATIRQNLNQTNRILPRIWTFDWNSIAFDNLIYRSIALFDSFDHLTRSIEIVWRVENQLNLIKRNWNNQIYLCNSIAFDTVWQSNRIEHNWINLSKNNIQEKCHHGQTMSIERDRTKIAIEPIKRNRTRLNNCDSIVERNRIAIERPLSG